MAISDSASFARMSVDLVEVAGVMEVIANDGHMLASFTADLKHFTICVGLSSFGGFFQNIWGGGKNGGIIEGVCPWLEAVALGGAVIVDDVVPACAFGADDARVEEARTACRAGAVTLAVVLGTLVRVGGVGALV